MPRFSQHSKDQLSSCHRDLRLIMENAILYFDFRVLEGFRDQDRQYRLYSKGLSHVKWPMSKHNARTPSGEPESRAVDLAPWPIDWNKLHRFVLMAGRILQIADKMLEDGEIGFKLRWGGDWNMDDVPVYDDDTEHFADYGHFELVQP